jgi:hypothetical protein
MAEGPKAPPEIIINQWVFVQHYKTPDGEFPLIYQLGVRLYAATGSDNEKLALLGKLAAWDFHLASIFSVPESRSVHLGLAGDPRAPTLKGVVPIQLATGPEQQMALFADTLEAVRKRLPEDPLTNDFKHTPLEDLSLLYTFTQVDVDENGRMKALTRHPELSTGEPQVGVNLWAFPDRDPRLVQSVAGRAYLAPGDRASVEAILENLSAADYLLASRVALPTPLAMADHGGGAAPGPMGASATAADEEAVFAFVEDQIQEQIPVKYTDLKREGTHRFTLPSHGTIRHSSVVSVGGWR